jgi:hypothetical protein
MGVKNLKAVPVYVKSKLNFIAGLGRRVKENWHFK